MRMRRHRGLQPPGFIRRGILRAAATISAIAALHVVALTTLPTGCSSACTPDPRMSFYVEVIDAASGAAVCDATVTYASEATSAARAKAEPRILAKSCTYSGPNEAVGTFAVTVERSGFTAQTQTVDVPFDGCHVEMQRLRVALERVR